MAKIADILASGPSSSFEFFPPKTPAAEEQLELALGELEPLHPSFVSVTYGAGGSTRERTHDLVVRINRDTSMTAMAHLTCAAHTRAELSDIVTRYRDAEVENILTLGGDPPKELSLPPGELTHAIDICEFVSIDEIDPLFFRKGYYLLPQEGAEKPYRLLLKALEETDRVAIAKIVIRDKQHLACLRPGKDVLLLETMYYLDELRLPERGPAPALRDAEKKMASSLIDNLTTKWKPEKYHDQYRNELLDLFDPARMAA